MNFMVLCMLVGLMYQSQNPLESFRWKNRIIVVYEEENNALGKQQLAELRQYPQAISERHLALIKISGTQVFKDGKPYDIDYEHLKEHLKITGTGFQVLLIGKDGGIKLREKRFTPARKFFDRIDSMPMRQAEMRNN